MTLRRAVIGGVLLVLAAGGTWVLFGRGDSSYASLRQAKTQQVPGTWGLVLEPPGGLAPRISPERAYEIAAGSRPPSKMSRSLALLTNRITYVVDGEESAIQQVPAWVVVAHDVCIASFKGELVSSARRPEAPDRCTDKNLWIAGVNAVTGERIIVARGYDETGVWRPDREGF